MNVRDNDVFTSFARAIGVDRSDGELSDHLLKLEMTLSERISEKAILYDEMPFSRTIYVY